MLGRLNPPPALCEITESGCNQTQVCMGASEIIIDSAVKRVRL